MIDITKYTIKTKLNNNYKIVVASDLHNYNNEKVIKEIKALAPDVIFVPGDFIHGPKSQANGIAFVTECAKIAPTYLSIGNHEKNFDGDLRKATEEAGCILLDNEFATYKDIIIGGLSSNRVCDNFFTKFKKSPAPNLEFINEFNSLSGFKILLNHHPEYYVDYLKDKDIDLIISGHAHGGQWIIGNRGVFAPGQGIFPKYTQGLHDNKLIVSRGIGNPHKVPRINNRPELLLVNLEKE